MDQGAGEEGYFRVSKQQQLNNEPVHSDRMSALRASVMYRDEAQSHTIKCPLCAKHWAGYRGCKDERDPVSHFTPAKGVDRFFLYTADST